MRSDALQVASDLHSFASKSRDADVALTHGPREGATTRRGCVVDDRRVKMGCLEAFGSESRNTLRSLPSGRASAARRFSIASARR